MMMMTILACASPYAPAPDAPVSCVRSWLCALLDTPVCTYVQHRKCAKPKPVPFSHYVHTRALDAKCPEHTIEPVKFLAKRGVNPKIEPYPKFTSHVPNQIARICERVAFKFCVSSFSR